MPTPDGIAELWFEEVPGHQAGSDHEVTRLLLADEVLFLSALVGYTVEPVEARHGPASKVWWTGRWCRGEPSPEDLAATDACLDMIRQRADSSGLQRVRMGERPFTRRALASEPLAPQVFFTGGFDGEATAAARAASTTNELERACTGHVESWSTLMCEELCIL